MKRTQLEQLKYKLKGPTNRRNWRMATSRPSKCFKPQEKSPGVAGTTKSWDPRDRVVMLSRIACILMMITPMLHAADICSEAELQGPYGFHLSGTSSISGSPTQVVGVARVVFAAEGVLSGYSSVSFNGLLLGNPVRGTYEVKQDCTMTFSLQDDSGAFQHFNGRVAQGGDRAEFRQVDTGTNGSGVIRRTSDACRVLDFQGPYSMSLSGATIPMETAGPSRPVSSHGRIEADGAGKFTVRETLDRADSSTPLAATGTYEIDSDCTVRIELTPMKLRGILVNNGKEILAIQTDAGETVSAQFVKR
jgi:hypothetical protein